MRATCLVFALALAFAVSAAEFNVEQELAIFQLGEASTNFFNKRMESMSNSTKGVGRSFGADVSTLVPVDHWRCLVGKGLSFAIPRGYQSVGHDDPNGIANVKNALAGGMAHVDYYFFPCPKCGQSPAEQIYHSVEHMRSGGAKFGMVWFDIEGAQYWTGNYDHNRRLFQNLLEGASRTGAHCGIYSSKYMWEAIFGTGFTLGGNMPLWYAHYDNDPSFNDFKPFGGFRSPAIKQFSDKGSQCGVSYDISAY